MTNEAAAKLAEIAERRRQAVLKIDRFEKRFEPSYRQLARYAALPLVLTPELVNYLRVQFLKPQHVPWVAEADLLLSDLCYPVGYEQYAMESAVRDCLIDELQTHVGQKTIESVARLLIRYIQHLHKTNAYLTPYELQSQQWAAMVFIENQRSQAVQQIAQAYQNSVDTIESTGKVGLSIKSEMQRLTRITQELAPQISQYEGLVAYAKLVSQVLADPAKVAPDRFNQAYSVVGVTLTLPSVLQPEIRTQPDRSFPGIPELEDFEYVTPVVQFEDDRLPNPSDDRTNDIGLISEVKTVEVATITIDPDDPKPDRPDLDHLEPFEFQIKTIVESGRRWLTITNTGTSYRFVEPLAEGIDLEMVAIPRGEFEMGSPEGEPERYDDESPQHHVTVPGFFMGRYPITQAQWRVVAGFPKVNRDLKTDPSLFKGDDQPVEQVNWYDVVEFCRRLSCYTGREYRLPSEAEWEYACRSGTTTPFHFGAMITTEVANYNGSAYTGGPKGGRRGKTTPVTKFGIANMFGLSDMHGNVREWCLDHGHKKYKGAPTDGSAWLSDDKGAQRVYRGGSWNFKPRSCRSAYRGYSNPDYQGSYIGFRVVIAPRGSP